MPEKITDDVIDNAKQHFRSLKAKWDTEMIENCRRPIMELISLHMVGERHQAKRNKYRPN